MQNVLTPNLSEWAELRGRYDNRHFSVFSVHSVKLKPGFWLASSNIQAKNELAVHLWSANLWHYLSEFTTP